MKPTRKNDPEYQRLLAEETLILEATERIVALLEAENVSRQELAERLGKSKGFVSQLLSGDRNMTLRTLASLGYVLGHTFRMMPVALEMAGIASDPTHHQGHHSPAIEHASVSTDNPSQDEASDSHEYALAA